MTKLKNTKEMKQEIKQKLEQAAETAWEQDQKTNPTPVNPYAYVYGYKAGAQTILENPEEFGLVDAIKAQHSVCDVLSKNEKLATEVTHMHYQLSKYREALERLLEENMCSHAGDELIEEALKQED